MKTKWMLPMIALGAIPGAYAGICGADDTVLMVEAAGFSCTVGSDTFSKFSFSGVPTSAFVQFGAFGSLDTVSLNRDGTFFTGTTLTMNYTVSTDVPIVLGTTGVDVSFPGVDVTTTMNGLAMVPPTIVNGGMSQLVFNPGVNSVRVSNTVTINGGQLNSLTNDFTAHAAGVPEPATAGLLALGLAGVLMWGRRRK